MSTTLFFFSLRNFVFIKNGVLIIKQYPWPMHLRCFLPRLLNPEVLAGVDSSSYLQRPIRPASGAPSAVPSLKPGTGLTLKCRSGATVSQQGGANSSQLPHLTWGTSRVHSAVFSEGPQRDRTPSCPQLNPAH